MITERILVTGAGGFLGSYFCQYFGRKGHQIAAVGRFAFSDNASDFYPNLWKLCGMTLPDDSFISTVKDFKPTLLIHCAGTSSVEDSVKEPYQDFQKTVEVCAFTLDTIRIHSPLCRFILLSSAAVYGEPERFPISESFPCMPISPYGYHKRMCETLCEEYHNLYKMPVAIIRIFSAYGERLKRQVIYDLCRKFFDADSETVEVFGTGQETRDFIHAVDIAQAIACIHNADKSGIFNVASGNQTSIHEIVELLKQICDSSKVIQYDRLFREGIPRYWQADISAISSLGFKQEIPFAQGIEAYCRWFLSHYNLE